MKPSPRRVLTLHADISMTVQLALLDAVEATLLDQGASRVWIDPEGQPDLVVVADFDEP